MRRPVSFRLQSPNTSKSVLIVMAVNVLQALLRSLGMRFMPVMCLPQDVNIYPFVQLYVHLPIKYHTVTFLVSLNNLTLVPGEPEPIYMTVGRLQWPQSNFFFFFFFF